MDFVVVIAHAEDRLQRSFEPSDFTDGTVGRLVTEEDYKVLEEVTRTLPHLVSYKIIPFWVDFDDFEPSS